MEVNEQLVRAVTQAVVAQLMASGAQRSEEHTSELQSH